MSNGKGLAVAGLIFGLIGAGLGGYVFFNSVIMPILGMGASTTETPESPASDTNTYYTEQEFFSPDTSGIYVNLGNMSINFTTNQTVKLYALFTCYARIQTASGDTVYINMYLNDSPFSTSYYYIDAVGYQPTERYSVNIQAYNQSLPAGTYNVSIKVDVDDTNTYFFLNSLFVQTNT
jgi:hypothetical protein